MEFRLNYAALQSWLLGCAEEEVARVRAKVGRDAGILNQTVGFES
jgi:hypothetical protein